jgi:hypothetical protein
VTFVGYVPNTHPTNAFSLARRHNTVKFAKRNRVGLTDYGWSRWCVSHAVDIKKFLVPFDCWCKVANQQIASTVATYNLLAGPVICVDQEEEELQKGGSCRWKKIVIVLRLLRVWPHWHYLFRVECRVMSLCKTQKSKKWVVKCWGPYTRTNMVNIHVIMQWSLHWGH